MPIYPADVIKQLNHEWARASDQPVSWAAHEPVLAAAVTAADAMVLLRSADEPDAVLLALVRRAQAGDAMAGRAVVQAVVGALILVGRRDRRLAAGDLVAALWLRLMAYPTQRRPHSVAANLVLDARKDVLSEVRPLRLLASAPRPTGQPTLAEVLERADELKVLGGRQRAVLATVYGGGLTSGEAGARLGMSADLVRWYCSTSRRSLARHRNALLAG